MDAVTPARATADPKTALRKKIAASKKVMRKIDREITVIQAQVTLARETYMAEGMRCAQWQDELETIEWREACLAGKHGPLVTLPTGTPHIGPGVYAIAYVTTGDVDPRCYHSFKQVNVRLLPAHDSNRQAILDIRSSEGCFSGDGTPFLVGNGSVGDTFSDADIAVILANLPRLPGGVEALAFLRTWSPLAALADTIPAHAGGP